MIPFSSLLFSSMFLLLAKLWLTRGVPRFCAKGVTPGGDDEDLISIASLKFDSVKKQHVLEIQLKRKEHLLQRQSSVSTPTMSSSEARTTTTPPRIEEEVDNNNNNNSTHSTNDSDNTPSSSSPSAASSQPKHQMMLQRRSEQLSSSPSLLQSQTMSPIYFKTEGMLIRTTFCKKERKESESESFYIVLTG